MKRSLLAMLTLVCVGALTLVFADNVRDLRARLSGFQEVPTLSTSGDGRFRARISHDETSVDWTLTYEGTESDVTQAHIHFSAPALNGPVVVFLCSNLGNGPAGTQACPAAPATISGTFVAADVLGNASAQGLEAGNLEELIVALRAGATYANVHTTGRPGGEIRGQIAIESSRSDHAH